jgi:glutamine amidotransferase
MQLLATRSLEFGEHQGLDLIPGTVGRLKGGPGLRVPHVGWNDLEVRRADDPLLRELGPEPTFYFVHSYEFHPDDPASVTGVTDYGGPVTATVAAGNVRGVQFHPEKSAADGLSLLRGFLTC